MPGALLVRAQAPEGHGVVFVLYPLDIILWLNFLEVAVELLQISK